MIGRFDIQSETVRRARMQHPPAKNIGHAKTAAATNCWDSEKERTQHNSGINTVLLRFGAVVCVYPEVVDFCVSFICAPHGTRRVCTLLFLIVPFEREQRRQQQQQPGDRAERGAFQRRAAATATKGARGSKQRQGSTRRRRG